MMIRGEFRDFFGDTALPALKAIGWKAFKAKKPMYSRLLRVESTTRDIMQFSQIAGVGLPVIVGEGEDVPTDNFVPGPSKTFKAAKTALGIACSKEMIEDDKWSIVAQRPVALSNSIYQSRELYAASIFNNAFTAGAYAGPDGVALCASNHPLYKAGGTQNNLLGSAADLDVASLELALTDWELTKTHEGFYQMLPKPRVLVASANRWNVAEILKSQMRSDTANNTRNAFLDDTEQGGPIEPLVWGGFLSDPDAWFLVAPPQETELVWMERKAPYTWSDFVAKNETGYMYMAYRADFGFHGWKGIYGTPGAA